MCELVVQFLDTHCAPISRRFGVRATVWTNPFPRLTHSVESNFSCCQGSSRSRTSSMCIHAPSWRRPLFKRRRSGSAGWCKSACPSGFPPQSVSPNACKVAEAGPQALPIATFLPLVLRPTPGCVPGSRAPAPISMLSRLRPGSFRYDAICFPARFAMPPDQRLLQDRGHRDHPVVSKSFLRRQLHCGPLYVSSSCADDILAQHATKFCPPARKLDSGILAEGAVAVAGRRGGAPFTKHRLAWSHCSEAAAPPFD